MSTEYERRLLARARELTDLSDMRDDTLTCLGAARHAGLDPEALSGLTGCAAALGADAMETYRAGAGWSGRHADERHFIGHVSDIEDEIEDHLHAARRLGEQAGGALEVACRDLDAARDQLAAAYAMPVGEPCNGCHGRKAAAIAAAEQLIQECEVRVEMCEDMVGAMTSLAARLRHALARIRAVPADLGETYESVYNLLRGGGRMPREGRWITGEEVPA